MQDEWTECVCSNVDWEVVDGKKRKVVTKVISGTIAHKENLEQYRADLRAATAARWSQNIEQLFDWLSGNEMLKAQ